MTSFAKFVVTDLECLIFNIMSMMKEDTITLCFRMSYRMEGEEQVKDY
jgi:hypothetical protein